MRSAAAVAKVQGSLPRWAALNDSLPKAGVPWMLDASAGACVTEDLLNVGVLVFDGDPHH